MLVFYIKPKQRRPSPPTTQSCLTQLSLQTKAQALTEPTQPKPRANPHAGGRRPRPTTMPGDASSPTSTAAAALAQAEADLSAGRLRAAQRHARRAARLDPDSAAASVLLAATSVLLADAGSPRATLLLPEDPKSSLASDPDAIRRHYKSLSRSLRPGDGASSYPAAAAAAQEALRRAADAYAALKEEREAPPTFWTACAGCRLLHEFDRQYVGFRLTCPSCRRSFLAAEVPPPPPPKKHKAEKTLAEMQLQLAKRKGKDQRAAQSSSSGDSDEPSELEVPEEEPDSYHSGQMAVEDSDFYNFDADRMEKCFKRGQVWALYGDDDGMPRHYALVETASPGRQFRAQIRWLEHQPDGKEGKPCGAFKVGREVTVHSVNVFSHLVACERVAREAYRVYPKKGSVWALHAGEYADTGRPKYDFVVFLSGYSEVHGISFGYLEKVEGFRSIFARREIGVRAVQYLREGDVGLLSHQTPARKVSKGEASTLPRGDCWELDPASLPAELLHA
ncbi:uncharacterized protein [Aegilops tauschii subsp. strangulata]|nr:uncharacterized protein LOC109768942 [Aegilops tauschii subsp. strangulata]XP_044444392.1 uncharacterized protein LOC123170626 [Triticum aestivum]